MSCTEIYVFDKSGNAQYYGYAPNAWTGAMTIWRYIEEKYLPSCSPSRCMSMDSNKILEILDVVNSPKISNDDKICLLSTLPDMLIRKEDIPYVVEAFRNFPLSSNLPEQADVLENVYTEDNYIAVGWNNTSVNVDTWDNAGGYDENGESIPYNIFTMSEHKWMFYPSAFHQNFD